MGVSQAAIAIKSSEKDDIEGIDLLDDDCAVECIITKAALQEGWDCPFAYILVSLNNTASQQSMTQLLERRFRLPVGLPLDEAGRALECVECRFPIPETVELRAMRQLAHENGDLTQRSLFDYVPDDLNEYERSVALFLDAHPQVLWWYRNLVGPENFSVQGYRRNPIYPDFVVQEGKAAKAVARVLVLESKGKHLKGSEDTKYKRSVADYFNKTGRRVPWQKLAEEFEDNTFRFQILDEGEYADRDWRDELRRLLEQPDSA
jgi:type III restriction enzyme